MSAQDIRADSSREVQPRVFMSSEKGSRRLVFVVAIVTLAWAACMTLGVNSHDLQWAANIVLPIAIISIVAATTMRREHRFHQPLQNLAAALPKIRAGEEPIDHLSAVGESLPAEDDDSAAFKSIVRDIQETLRDVKRQKFELATLHEEVRQRIATRTNALERTIGTLRAAATRDILTGLGNRRMLEASLPKLLEHCRAENSPLSVLMIDVDYFKQLNDTLGHAAGDDFLRNLGQLIRSTVRPNDMSFRLGGDEFVIILPGADSTAAARLRARLGSLVESLCETIRVTRKPSLSIGVAQLADLPIGTSPDKVGDALLSLADQRLYAVKSTRKDRSRLAG